jgi:uncharacterized protein YjdB
LSITPDTQEVVVDQVVSFRALEVFLDSDEEDDVTFDVEWSVEPRQVATVVSPGRIRADEAGDAVIVARLGDLTAEATLVISDVRETLESLVIEPGVVETPETFEVRVQAIGVFDNGTSRDLSDEVDWSGDADNIFEVNFAGDEVRVRGLSVGSGNITASFGGEVATAPVTVTAAPLEAIEIVPATVTVPEGDRSQMSALGRFANGVLLDITTDVDWEVEDSSVARVSNEDGEEGLLTGLGLGNTLLTARSGQINGQASVRVTNPMVAQLSIDPPLLELAAGSVGFVRASAVISGNEAVDVTNEAQWSSDDESIATVAVAGNLARVELLRPGTTLLRARYGQREAVCEVTVTEARLVSVSIRRPEVTLPLGTQDFLFLVGTYSDDTRAFLNTNALWSTSDANVVIVDNGEFSGLISGRAQGRATVTATIEGLSASTEITVTDAEVVGLQITPPVATTPIGDNVGLSAFAVYSDNSLRGITDDATWESLDPELVSASNAPGERGLVTGIAPGDATVSATYQDFSDTATVTVTDAVVEELFIAPPFSALAVGRDDDLTLLAVYSNGSTLVVTQEAVWTSSSPDNVEVSNADGRRGRISALEQGEATITARFGRQIAEAQVFVIDSELTDLLIFPEEASTSPGLAVQLFAIGFFSDQRVNDNMTGEVVWTSSDESIATVSNVPQFPGRVTGVSPGTVTITARSGEVSATARVRVINRSVVGITISPPDPVLSVDAFQAMSAIADFDDGTTGDITQNVEWSSLDSSVVAFMPQQGLINTLVPGTAEIVAEFNGVEASTLVTVRPAQPTSLIISPVNPIIQLQGRGGAQVQFYATGLYEDMSTSDLTQLCEWTSSDPGTLLLFDELGAKGFAFATQAGSVQVTVRCGQLQSTTTVTIR